MLNNNWFSLFIICLCIVAVSNGLLASCTSLLYKDKKTGQLSHSQLRIKQGNAHFEHRINVFTTSFLFSFITLRLLLIALFFAVVTNLYFYFMP